MKPLADRFWPKVDKTPGYGPHGHCWMWVGARFKTGYGGIGLGTKRVLRAHRVAYELVIGPIPEGAVLDHLCRERACVNPAHLDPVTQGENIRRGVGIGHSVARRLGMTHCKRGHEFTAANVRHYRGTRVCRACCALRTMARYYDRQTLKSDDVPGAARAKKARRGPSANA